MESRGIPQAHENQFILVEKEEEKVILVDKYRYSGFGGLNSLLGTRVYLVISLILS